MKKQLALAALGAALCISTPAQAEPRDADFCMPCGVTEISLEGMTDKEPVWGALLLRPIAESDDHTCNTYFQTSIERTDGRTTFDAGIGRRRLVADNKVLLGANLFVDHEFPEDHERLSVGAELRTSVVELNTNYYRALTGWKDVSDTVEEQAMDGFDIEAGVPLPYLPSTQVRYKHSIWNGIDDVSDIHGNTVSLAAAILPGMEVEAGYTGYNNQPSERFMKVTYMFGGTKLREQKTPRVSDKAYSFDSMEDRRFEKVRRENRSFVAETEEPLIL